MKVVGKGVDTLAAYRHGILADYTVKINVLGFSFSFLTLVRESTHSPSFLGLKSLNDLSIKAEEV